MFEAGSNTAITGSGSVGKRTGTPTRLARMARPQGTTVVLETGLQNAPLSLTLAISMLDSTEIAIPSLLYAGLMMPTAFAAVGLARWTQRT